MPDADVHLDATGLVCPEPLMIVRNKVREMETGQVIHVVATDPSTSRDFRNFCRFMGHELLAEARRERTEKSRERDPEENSRDRDEDDGTERFEYWIRKGSRG